MNDDAENAAGKVKLSTHLLDELEEGPWPSFVADLKNWSKQKPQVAQLLNQLNDSYQNRWNYWTGTVINVTGYGGGIIARLSDKAEEYPDLAEFHTLRILPAAGFVYSTERLRNLSEICTKHGAGILQLHGLTGDILALGFTSEASRAASEELMENGWDLGGSGAGMRTLQCCVGQARCEMACFDTMRTVRHVTNNYINLLHRPEFMYKFKIKVSGCGNDCANAMISSDMPIMGAWRGPMQIDQEKVTEFIDENGIESVIDNVITRCPTNCISLKDRELVVDHDNCVRCMHCINVMHRALKPGKNKGVTICLGAKRTLKIGDTMSSVIVPFMPLQSDEDFDNLTDLIDRIWDFWNENGLDHERIGEFIARVGLGTFLDGVGLEPDPRMVAETRTSPFIKFEELAPGRLDGEQEQEPQVWQREPEASEAEL